MLKGEKNNRFLGPFILTLTIIQSFEELSNTWTKATVVAHFNPAKPIRLEIDTSGYAIADIILQ